MTKINDATEFLEALYPQGAWAVTAIHSDDRRTETKTFYKRNGGDVAMRRWLDDRQDAANLYYHLNSVRHPVTKKASRTDIGAVRALHVDLDPEPDCGLVEEQERILGLLTYKLPKGVPEPPLIIFSGGGYQAIWLLNEGDWIKTNGDLGLAEDAKLYNVQLENLFGGDATHNIDRLLRLPFTTNHPDARKVAKGRSKSDTLLLKSDFGLTYPLSKFKRAAASNAGGINERIDVHVGEIEIPDGQLLLDAGVSPRVLEIIVKGHDPENPKDGDNSRSAWVHDVACGLARAGVRVELIVGTLMNREWGISESIYLNKNGASLPNPENYAKRQAVRAIQRVETEGDLKKDDRQAQHNGWLDRLNDDHCVLMREGGKCRIMTWEPSEMGDGRLLPVLQSRSDFENSYANMKVEVPTAKSVSFVPVGKWWFEHAKRKQYTAMRFDPSTDEQVLPGGYLNLWRGFNVLPKAGDWSRMRKHIVDVVAQGDTVSAEYIVNWTAWTLQNPQHPAEVALVLKGGRGTGKGFFGRALTRIYGQHGLHITGPAHLTGKFNKHLRDCVVLFADEALIPGDKQAESILKTLITEPTLIVEGKGQDAIQAVNRTHLIMASNEDWVVPAGVDERRFAVFEIAPKTRDRGAAYFNALSHELEHGGYEAMLHDLLGMDLGNWHPRNNVPNTAALNEQKLRSLNPADEWLLGVLEEGFIQGVRPSKANAPPCSILSGSPTTGRELGLYDEMRKAVPAMRNWSDKKLANVVKDAGAQAGRDSNTLRYWEFPPLETMRSRWEERFGRRIWPDPNYWPDDQEPKMPF